MRIEYGTLDGNSRLAQDGSLLYSVDGVSKVISPSSWITSGNDRIPNYMFVVSQQSSGVFSVVEDVNVNTEARAVHSQWLEEWGRTDDARRAAILAGSQR
jgi:hypothetical protein